MWVKNVGVKRNSTDIKNEKSVVGTKGVKIKWG